MVFGFAALPPEINSTRMYTCAGSGPLMGAAAAWNDLAEELGTTARICQSVISQLTGDQWVGPSSAAMATGAEAYVAWMQATAGQLQHAATHAMASAAAYETAFAMTVPPPVVAANRVRLAALVATNILGQNTPAIAATEAQYAEMWAQDAAAMYGYAGSSASAGVLTPLTSPTAGHQSPRTGRSSRRGVSSRRKQRAAGVWRAGVQPARRGAITCRAAGRLVGDQPVRRFLQQQSGDQYRASGLRHRGVEHVRRHRILDPQRKHRSGVRRCGFRRGNGRRCRRGDGQPRGFGWKTGAGGYGFGILGRQVVGACRMVRRGPG